MKYRYQSDDLTGEVELERRGDVFYAMIAGKEHILQILSAQPGELDLMIDGRPQRIYWAESGALKWLAFEGCAFRLEKPAAYSAQRHGGISAEDKVMAPMPAQVRSVLVAPGDAIEEGEPLLILEAMKMEIRINAQRSGVVRHVLVEDGQTVQRDQLLVEISG